MSKRTVNDSFGGREERILIFLNALDIIYVYLGNYVHKRHIIFTKSGMIDF